MRTIHRYELPITDRPVIDMPLGSVVLSAPPSERVRGHIEIWAEVNTALVVRPRAFRIVGTGNPLPEDCGRFIGTVVSDDGRFVWHVYEAEEQR